MKLGNGIEVELCINDSVDCDAYYYLGDEQILVAQLRKQGRGWVVRCTSLQEVRGLGLCCFRVLDLVERLGQDLAKEFNPSFVSI